jgi:hypothetical protein
MSTHTELIERYLAIWNEADADVRATAVATLFTEDATYTDPLAAVSGHEGIAAVITQARNMFPGHVFRPHGTADGHHDLVRFGWELVPAAGGDSAVVGFDVAVFHPNGRLRSVHGFLDKVPAAV